MTDFTPGWFWRHVDRSGGPDACWPWTRGKTSAGLGALWHQGEAVTAHRAALYFLGHLPSTKSGKPGRRDSRYLVVRTCGNPACCNPRHMRIGGKPVPGWGDDNADLE